MWPFDIKKRKREREEKIARQERIEKRRNQLIKLVNECITNESTRNINKLNYYLNIFHKVFSQKESGKDILEYEDKENLSLCFSFLIFYNKQDSLEIKQKWAEKAFYCIIDQIQHKTYGYDDQAESMIILFVLLSVGRDLLKQRIQNILDENKNNSIFHKDDYVKGAQHVIDQISVLAVSYMRVLGQKAVPIMMNICDKFNSADFFEKTIKRKDLEKYDPRDVFEKAKFIRTCIEKEL